MDGQVPSELPNVPNGVQQVVINVNDNNFSDIFPQEQVELIVRLKNARKRSADDDDTTSRPHTPFAWTTVYERVENHSI
ncbi:hypothetical protein BGZ67_006973 [Mortierella alpina]|nr:hypothetical protein BGZ67_006973 [Mortierella alpina]